MRAYVLLGRAASGLFSLAMVGITARAAGLAVAGDVAVLVSGIMGLVEIADVSSQRHVVRIEMTADADDREGRLAGFRLLRWVIFLCGLLFAVPVLITLREGSSVFGKLAVVTAAAWFLHTNWQYARALALDRFDVIGLGPLIGLGVSFGMMIALGSLDRMDPFWVMAAALHTGKGAEVAFLKRQLRRDPSRNGFGHIREEWKHVRFLFGQGVLSAANSKLIVPLAAFSAGPAAAAILSIGVSLVSVVSLGAIAIVIPSYRRWATGGRRWRLSAVLRRSRTEWLLGATVSASLAVAIWTGLVGWMLRRGLHLDSSAVRAALFVILGGVFEPAFLIAGAIYQICLRDRLLLMLSVVTVLLSWVGLVIGGRLGGVEGMARAYLATRAACVVVVCGPLVLAYLREDS
jgi:O-antigen/teichoic acid export membrane protein